MIRIEIRPDAFDPLAEVARYQQAAFPQPGVFGATAVFIGTMRDFNDDVRVSAMVLEHYPGMTERELEAGARSVGAQWRTEAMLVVHRVGVVTPGEPIVLVAAWSGHRLDAFEACRQLMEYLKSRAPFWKKETHADGARWVEQNTPGRPGT